MLLVSCAKSIEDAYSKLASQQNQSWATTWCSPADTAGYFGGTISYWCGCTAWGGTFWTAHRWWCHFRTVPFHLCFTRFFLQKKETGEVRNIPGTDQLMYLFIYVFKCRESTGNSFAAMKQIDSRRHFQVSISYWLWQNCLLLQTYFVRTLTTLIGWPEVRFAIASLSLSGNHIPMGGYYHQVPL